MQSVLYWYSHIWLEPVLELNNDYTTKESQQNMCGILSDMLRKLFMSETFSGVKPLNTRKTHYTRIFGR